MPMMNEALNYESVENRNMQYDILYLRNRGLREGKELLLLNSIFDL